MVPKPTMEKSLYKVNKLRNKIRRKIKKPNPFQSNSKENPDPESDSCMLKALPPSTIL